MIQVPIMDEGFNAVIDGMHRVTALQELFNEKWDGIDYDKVKYRLPATTKSERVSSVGLGHSLQ
jgi:hypothetical protein